MATSTWLVGAIVPALLASALAQEPQERSVPKDSDRLTLTGCVNNRTFITASTPEHESSGSSIGEGRRFRLAGPGKMLDDIKARKGRMVQITGLVKKSAVSGPGGIAIAGGRVRIGGRQPQTSIATDPTRDPAYNQAVLDVEGWNQLADPCPTR